MRMSNHVVPIPIVIQPILVTIPVLEMPPVMNPPGMDKTELPMVSL